MKEIDKVNHAAHQISVIDDPVSDADGIKVTREEFQQLKAVDDPIAAAVVHEESSDMAGLLRRSLRAGFNTVFDSVGDSTLVIWNW